MFGAIKRLFGNKGKIMFDTDWENLNLEEKLSILADMVSESEFDRILMVISRPFDADGYNWSFETIKNIRLNQDDTACIYFIGSDHPLMFFPLKNDDI